MDKEDVMCVYIDIDIDRYRYLHGNRWKRLIVVITLKL